MTQTVAAREVTLHDLRAKFGLELVFDDDLFPEWSEDLPAISESEQLALDRIKRNYLYLLEYPMMESIVKMLVLAPLLDIAGFYEPPFRVNGETNIAVLAEDEGEIIRGSIDVLVVQDQLWVTTIEAKNSQFSISKATPQTLAYMLAAPNLERPVFGAILNGSEFLFLKLVRNQSFQYATSNLFSLLNHGNDLCSVLRVLKKLRELIST